MHCYLITEEEDLLRAVLNLMNYFFNCYVVLHGRSFPALEEALKKEPTITAGNREYFRSEFEAIKQRYKEMIDPWRGTKLFNDDDFPPLLSAQDFPDCDAPVNVAPFLNGETMIDVSHVKPVEPPTVVSVAPPSHIVPLRNMVLLLNLGHRLRKSGIGMEIPMLLSTFLPALSDEVFVNEYVMGSYVREVSLFSKKAKRWLYDLSSHLRCRSVLQDMLMQACACNQDGKTVVDLLAQQEHVTYSSLMNLYQQYVQVLSPQDPGMQKLTEWVNEVKEMKSKCREWRQRKKRTEFSRYLLREELLGYKRVGVVGACEE